MLAACGSGGGTPKEAPPLVVGLNGRVVNEAGAPVRAARVEVYRQDSGEPAYDTNTDAGGYYRLADVAPGIYTLMAGAAGLGGLMQDVEVGGGDRVTQDLQVAPPGRIVGTATLEDTTDASGISLLLLSGIFFTTTYPDGSFELAGVPAGTYVLTAERSGYVTEERTGVVVAPGEATSVDLVLVPRNGEPAIEEFSADPVSGVAPLEVSLSWRVWSPDGEAVPCTLEIEGAAVESFDDCLSTNSAHHVFQDAGSYRLVLRLASGASSAIDVMARELGPPPPPAVEPPVIVAFDASPESIEAGQSATLSWQVTGEGTLEVTLDRGFGDVTGLGEVTVSPLVTTTYTLTATNEGGTVSRQATVAVTQAASCVPDPVLEAAIREELGLGSGSLDCGALAGLKELEVEGASDMEGLQYAVSLRELTWKDGEATDLSPLGGLAALDKLELEDSRLHDLSPLANLGSLAELSLDGSSGVIDFSPLSGLAGIQILGLDNTGIGNLSPLAELLESGGLGKGDEVSLRENPLDLCGDTEDTRILWRLWLEGVDVRPKPWNGCDDDDSTTPA